MLENMSKAVRNVLIVMIIVMALGVFAKASAQDSPMYICRTDRADLTEIAFHNYSQLGDSFWYIGQGYEDPNDPTTFLVQAVDHMDYVDETNYVRVGESIMGNQDYSIVFIGTPETPVCGQGEWTQHTSGYDWSVLPDQNPGPASTRTPDNCPAWSFDENTGETICLWDLPFATN